jgi:hypothetical protein
MVTTVKFSEFSSANLDSSTLEDVGLESGINVKFSRYPTWTTAGRPATPFNGLMGYNTTLQRYEFWDAVDVVWYQLEDNTDIAVLLALLASHAPGEGASLIGLEGAGTVQDFVEAQFYIPAPNALVPNGIVFDPSDYLLLTGGTMLGNIDMDGNDVVDIGTASFQSGAFSQSFTSGVLAGNLAYTLPTDYPAVSGYVLSSTDAGVMSWIDNTTGLVDSVTGTLNQVDVDNTDPQNPVVSLSPTIDTPGTFTIGTTVVIDSIIDDDTFATATNSNIPTAQSVKNYVDTTGATVRQILLLMGA